MCVFVYEVDNTTEPASDREAMRFTEIYLGEVEEADFRKNERGDLGTRTATLHKDGIAKLRKSWGVGQNQRFSRYTGERNGPGENLRIS